MANYPANWTVGHNQLNYSNQQRSDGFLPQQQTDFRFQQTQNNNNIYQYAALQQPSNVGISAHVPTTGNFQSYDNRQIPQSGWSSSFVTGPGLHNVSTTFNTASRPQEWFNSRGGTGTGTGAVRAFSRTQQQINRNWTAVTPQIKPGSRWDALRNPEPISLSQEEIDAWNIQQPRDQKLEQELFERLNLGINFERYEDIPVDATGKNIPPFINTFGDLKLHNWVMDNVKLSGYQKPTPVQKNAIPVLLNDRDLMACAQTGSGKTAAFLLPVINSILNKGPRALLAPTLLPTYQKSQHPACLILAPTRELSIQIDKECRKFAYRTPIRSALLYGGRENYRDQISKLGLGVHILIATPGRLMDVIEKGLIALNGCRFLVLDEADRMLDMGFEPQIRKIVQGSDLPPKDKRVTAMFSATFPKEIQLLAKDFLVPDYVFLAVGRVGSTSENISQRIIWVEQHDKYAMLMELMEARVDESLTLVFVGTKRGAAELAMNMELQGFDAKAIHGDLKQCERERYLQQFRSGAITILVATAVAARGLDIPNVNHVINYDLPGDFDEYIHRIGRTGRVGNIGMATSFFNETNSNLARNLSALLVESNQELPDWLEEIARQNRYQQQMRQANRGRGGIRANRFGGQDHREQYSSSTATTANMASGYYMQYGQQNQASNYTFVNADQQQYQHLY